MALADNLVSYYKLDGDSDDAVGSNDGTDTNVLYSNPIFTNLVSYYDLEGNSNDRIGSNNGSDTSITYSTANGKISQGGGFNGTSSKIINANSDGAFDQASPTFSCWVKPDWTSGANGYNPTMLAVRQDGVRFSFHLKDDYSTIDIYNGSTVYSWNVSEFSKGVWCHVAFKLTGGKFTVYVNGSSKGEVTGSLGSATTNNFSIGSNGAGAEFWKGAIDEVGYWSSALTDGNITTIYNTTSGKINQGAGFNGSTSKIVGSAVNIPTNATISCWFKTTQSPAGGNYPLFFGFVGTPYFDFFTLPTSDYIRLALSDSDGVYAVVDTSTTYNDGDWHFLVGVKTGSSIELFVDGDSKGTDSDTFTGNFNSCTMRMGTSTGTNQYYNGAVDECAYWERALSSAEVGQLYWSGDGNQYPFSTAYTLAVTVGAFTLTGIATTLLKALKMVTAVGSFVLTGIDVALKRGYTIVSNVGSFVLTGIDVGITKSLTIATAVGDFVLTGINVTLGWGKSMIANVGSFIISWKDVIFKGLWANQTNYSNATKNTTTYSNQSKNTSSWTYKTKNL